MSSNKNHSRTTRLMHMGRKPEDYFGIVNPPICRTSTILYDNMSAYRDPNTKFRYGRVSTPLSNSFEEAMAELEGGYHAITAPSGLSAVTTSILSFVKSGDHVLIVDGCYPPTRFFCNRHLKKIGIEVEFYNPSIGANIKSLIRSNTSLIYMESPCSSTFELQDVPAITRQAKAHGVATIMDNTWSAGILFRPIDHGVDISLQSAAKYISGHSDVNLGVAVAADEILYKRLKAEALDLGVCAGADDLYLAMRGLRTLEMRLKNAAQNMQPVLEWFKGRKEVQELYCPILKSAAGHEIWKRDYLGHNGIFSVLFKSEYSMNMVDSFIDSLDLFPVGSSWGGYESLVQPQNMASCRSNWDKNGECVRFQVGGEDPQDLINDLEQGIANLRR